MITSPVLSINPHLSLSFTAAKSSEKESTSSYLIGMITSPVLSINPHLSLLSATAAKFSEKSKAA